MRVMHGRTQWSGARGWTGRCVRAAVVSVAALAGSASAAQAGDSVAIQLATASPARGASVVIHVGGHATTPPDTPPTPGRGPYLRMVVQAASESCEPSYGADKAAYRDARQHSFAFGPYGNGDVSLGFPEGQREGDFAYDPTFAPALGSYRVCAWLGTQDPSIDPREQPADQVSATASATFTTRSADTLKVTGPNKAVAGRPAVFRVSAHANPGTFPGGGAAPSYPQLLGFVRSARSGACPAHAEQTSRRFAVAGPYTLGAKDRSYTVRVNERRPGAYRLCFYITSGYRNKGDRYGESEAMASAPLTVVAR